MAATAAGALVAVCRHAGMGDDAIAAAISQVSALANDAVIYQHQGGG